MKNETTTVEIPRMTKLTDGQSTFTVEKVKLNKAPRHFFLEDAQNKTMAINGKKVKVMMRPERTQYVLFQLSEKNDKGEDFVQSYYVRDHKFFEADKVKTFVKVKKEKPVKEQPKAEEATAEATA